jgi:hypothetical protein
METVKESAMKQPGTIRFCLGLILVFGAVGGMDDHSLADYLVEQISLAVLGLALMLWGGLAIERDADRFFG